MKHSYVYEIATGLFTGRVALGDDVHPDDVPDGCAVLDLDDRIDVRASRVILADDKPQVVEWQPPPPPDDEMQTWAWDSDTRRWVATPTLAAYKAAKWAQIKAEREQRIRAAGQTGIGTLQLDPQSMINIIGVTLGLVVVPSQADIEFTLADNSRPTIARTDFIVAALAALQAIQGIHRTAHVLRQQIDAAQDQAALDAIEWPQ